MATKTFNITITGDTDAKCAEKLQAAIDIINALSYDDLIGLAKLVKTKPGIIAKAKKLQGWF